MFLIEEASKLNPADEKYVSLLWDALTLVYKEALLAANK